MKTVSGYFDISMLSKSHFEIDKGHLWCVCVCLCVQMSYIDTGVHRIAAQNILTLPLKAFLSRKAAQMETQQWKRGKTLHETCGVLALFSLPASIL